MLCYSDLGCLASCRKHRYSVGSTFFILPGARSCTHPSQFKGIWDWLYIRNKGHFIHNIFFVLCDSAAKTFFFLSFQTWFSFTFISPWYSWDSVLCPRSSRMCWYMPVCHVPSTACMDEQEALASMTSIWLPVSIHMKLIPNPNILRVFWFL